MGKATLIDSKYIDNPDRSELIFSNENYISVIYKHMRDDRFVIHYKVGNVTGGLKVIPAWEPKYDDIMGQAECSMPHLFMPTLLEHLYQVNLNRLRKYLWVCKLYEEGRVAELKAHSWTSYYNLNDKSIKEYYRGASGQRKFMKALLLMRTNLPKESKLNNSL